jgi:ATP-dependent Clp protease protease subunit
MLLDRCDRQDRQRILQRATGKIGRGEVSPLHRELDQTRYLIGERVLASISLASYVSHSYRSAGNDNDPAGVLSMSIDHRLDEEEQPDTPAKEPKAAEQQSNLIDKNLFKSRTVLLFGEINDKVARSVTAQLIALSSESDKPIRLFINSPGGHVESGDTIFDIIRFVRAPVQVVGTGWVASAGALIFIAAKKENRFCLPNTRFMLHQPSGGTMGKASDIAIEAKEIIRMRQRLNETFARETGQPLEKITRDTERNFWMSADEAVAYGLVDKVINTAKEID